jgi:hypothetical protein
MRWTIRRLTKVSHGFVSAEVMTDTFNQPHYRVRHRIARRAKVDGVKDLFCHARLSASLRNDAHDPAEGSGDRAPCLRRPCTKPAERPEPQGRNQRPEQKPLLQTVQTPQ